jgi:hypothetical protein
LAALNRMISSWSLEGLVIHAVTAETPLALTPGDATVSMGTAGDIATRPISIESAAIRDGSTDYPIGLITADEYAALSDKSVQGMPRALYDDGGYPLRTLTLYPVPSAAHSLVLYTKRALTALTLDGTVSLPPGYERAIIYNGAVEIAPEYGRAASAEVVSIASEAKRVIKAANIKPRYLMCDSALVGGRPFSFETGDY